MSLNITCVSLDFIVCTTDRRVTEFGTQQVMTDRSAKLILLHCSDAVALITYNGIGSYAGKTPCDWLQELDARVGLARMQFVDAVKQIQDDVQARVQSLSSVSDRRHSFIIGGVVSGRPGIFVVSNYESAKDDRIQSTPQSAFSSTYAVVRRDLKPEDPKPALVLITGSTQAVDKHVAESIGRAIQQGSSAHAIKARCVKVIRDAALGANRSGAVGSSVLWAILNTKTGYSEGGLDVIGGTTLQELPWLIGKWFQMKEISVSAEEMTAGEVPCPKCRKPVPTGYRKCGNCGETLGRIRAK